MGLLDSFRKWLRSGSMRDRHADRASGHDPIAPRDSTPSGTVGPSGSALEQAQGKGGAIAPDPPEDRG